MTEVEAARSPFKGLSPFEDSEVDELLFFGREREREIVVANLIASRLTVLYGPSGVGKSSLLRASVARSLRELPEKPLVVTFSRWSDDPAAALVEAVAEAGGNGAAGSPLEALEHAQDGRDVYVVLDQAEEYFLYHADDGGPGSFAEALPELLAAPLRVNVLVSLREDSLAKLDRFTGRIPGLFANTLRLDRLDRASARAAIVRPLERFALLTGAAVAIEPELVDRVLDEVGAGQIEPALGGQGTVEGTERAARIEAPYLQLVMQRIWDEERRAGSDVLRVQTLERLGGAQRIVEVHLDDALSQLSPAQKAVAALLFNYLVTPSGTKIAHEVSDLADFGQVSPADVAPILAILTERRILRSVEEGDGVRYEIFHDVLAEPVLAWRTAYEAERDLAAQMRESDRRHRRLLALVALGAVLLAVMSGVTVYALSQRNEAQKQAASAEVARADAERQAARAEEEQQAAERAEREASESEAVAKSALEDAEEQRAQAEASEAQAEEQAEQAETSADQAEASAEQAQAAESKAQEATKQAEGEAARAEKEKNAADAARTEAEQSADEAKARALAEEALTLLDTRPLESLNLALRSAELEPTLLAERVLRASLVRSRVRHVLPGGGGPVVDATFSNDGRRALVVADSASVFDARTGALLRAIPDPRGALAASFSPDGARVVTAGRDGAARLWPVAGGPARVLRGHDGVVRDTAFSRDGSLLLTASEDRTAMLWRASTGERLATYEHDGPVFSVEINAAGTHVLTVSRVARTGRLIARLFDARSGDALRTFDQIGITSAIFPPDGSYAVTTSTDDTARVWDFKAQQARAILRHPDGNVVSAAFNRDGSKLVTASEGSSTTVWLTDTWVKEEGFTGPLNPATGAAFNPSGRFIVVTSRDRNAHLFNSDNGLRVAILSGHTESVTGASFSSDGRRLITASEDGSARIWEPGTEDLLELVGKVNDEPSRSVALSPDGRLAVSAGGDGTARILDVTRRRQLRVLRHEAALNSASFSPSGTLVLTASEDGTARLWRGGAQVQVLTHGGRGVRAVFSPDGELVATAGDDRVVRIWRTRDGRLLRVLRGHAGAVLDVVFSPNGRLVASAGDNADKTARIWSLDGKSVRVLRHQGPIVRVAFSPDGRTLATASGDEMARLWSVDTGALRRTLRGHSAFVRDVAFGPRGTKLVTAADDGDARIWSVRTGETLRVLRGHFSAVRGARFSADGRWIVTAGPRTALLWDVRTGDHVAPTGLADPFLRGPLVGPVTTALFTPDGRRIVTSSGDGTVRTFECTVCGRLPELMRLAQGRLNGLAGGLSDAERLRYLRA